MKVLLLAAGVGTRISRHLKGQPKSCVDLDGKPLIWHTFTLFNGHGISDIAIVTGYEEQVIFDALVPFDYQHYKNPFFSVTNSLASMWFAKPFFETADDNLIILNADLYLESNALERLLEIEKSPLFLADSNRIEDADYRFFWEGDRLLRYGKELKNEETTGEYVGIAKVLREDIPKMVERLDELIDAGRHEMWWEDLFYSYVPEGKPVYIEDIVGMFWAEVDFIEDYQRIKDYLAFKHQHL